jgi:hypothetical protein
MPSHRIAAALRDRLGHDASIGLVELVESEHTEWSERVLNVAVERFERRLAEEIASLRVAVVRELHDGRVEMLKWAFLFWVGQVAAVLGLLAYMFRATGR